mmetsp:Transcript_25505/g.63180  ORF Transcript_25505/g.63180 Transcript_25505/m.63180 type:complete len:101 (-) Transcript_25505:377-679(-)
MTDGQIQVISSHHLTQPASPPSCLLPVREYQPTTRQNRPMRCDGCLVSYACVSHFLGSVHCDRWISDCTATSPSLDCRNCSLIFLFPQWMWTVPKCGSAT